MAFVSTSRNQTTPIDYMRPGDGTPNVLWCLHPAAEDDVGYHCGADIAPLSQFANEGESLFPPCTMFEVVRLQPRRSLERMASSKDTLVRNSRGEEVNCKMINVLPSFV